MNISVKTSSGTAKEMLYPQQMVCSLKFWRSVQCSALWLIPGGSLLIITAIVSLKMGVGVLALSLITAPAYLPELVVHVMYWLEERHRTITLSYGSLHIVNSRTQEDIVIKRDDINSVERHLVYDYFAKGRHPLWEKYEYLDISLYTGERYFITSLLIDLDVVIHYLGITRWYICRRFFPVIKRNSR